MLVALPIAMFGDVADAGLAVRVSCRKCYQTRQLDLGSAELRARQIFGARLRCSRPGCGGTGIPSIEPVERILPSSAIERATLFCDACVPPWQCATCVLINRPGRA